MENYEILEQHRPSKTGGSVAIFLKKKGNKFVRRNDIEIFNEYCESIFYGNWEISLWVIFLLTSWTIIVSITLWVVIFLQIFLIIIIHFIQKMW